MKLPARLRYPLKRVVHWYLHRENRRAWEPRIADALASTDNQHIPRVTGAGRLRGAYVVMHNGIRIDPESYYGEPMRLLLERNRGVHEPQEERVFMEVLRYVPAGSTMLELGAYWGFYSLWFHHRVANARTILVEPDPRSLAFGLRNFAINARTGEFIQAYVGTAVQGGEVTTISVDELARERGISHLAVLHADVQGAELEMLKGAAHQLEERRIDYVFVSTHSNELHGACRELLVAHDYVILADADLDETYSFDGLLVARRRELAGLAPIAISKRPSGRMYA